MSTVFVVQSEQGRLDFRAAKRFGELSFVLGPTDSIFRIDDSLLKLTQRLSAFTKDDYLLPGGNPGLIGIATAIVADQTEGQFKMLQWLGREREYIPISVKLWN